MSRYRPPQPRSSLYITAAGYRRLQSELQGLWQRRHEVVKALAAAAAEGDRSENAEYIYRKKELREIDRRIRYLQKRLPELTVVSAAPSDPSRIYFGAWVSVEDEDGNEHTWRIVGPDEFDPEQGWISMDAPLARALMKKQVDDEVEIELPKGKTRYWITAIHYTP
ncbi:transcription elongation factor GreB [Sulfurivermis fontis]|uniref:transcription elongation factor GreB n=1 Tax=Sulfurivermis fontis TaxID=1972068 RepID=UPI000FD6CD4D|nr:transcription elongation factor GreB [Sulfurivermis fontis]